MFEISNGDFLTNQSLKEKVEFERKLFEAHKIWWEVYNFDLFVLFFIL